MTVRTVRQASRLRRVGRIASRSVAAVVGALSFAATTAADPLAKNQAKLALVIGAGAYSYHPLSNPPADAALVAEKLEKLDAFTHVVLLDDRNGPPVTKAAIDAAVLALVSEAKEDAALGHDVTVFFYFAGHGLEIGGESRLVPPSAVDLLHPDPDAARLAEETVSAQAVLDQLVESGAARVLIVLDACRENPWPTLGLPRPSAMGPVTPGHLPPGPGAATRSLGLVPLQVNNDAETMIMFAAAAKQRADDSQVGTGHSPFANALAVNLGIRGLSVREMFENVRSEVYAATDKRQKPDLSGVFEYALYPSGADGADHTSGDDFLRSVLRSGRTIGEIKDLAGKGDPFSEWMMSVASLEGIATPKDEAAAAKWARRAVGDGLIRATVTLAFLYHHGAGVTLDHKEGEAWDQVGVDHGVAVAMNNLGDDYLHGWGVDQDAGAAASWFRKAADAGLFLAQINLGNAYADGEGVPKDYAAALSWYEKAASAGDLAAMEAIGDLYDAGEPDIASPAKALAAYRRGFEAGDPVAARKIANIYASERPPDPTLVAQWEARAFALNRALADTGDVASQKLVAHSYEGGVNGLKADHGKAVEFYRRAAGQGDADAKQWLAAHDR